MKDYIQISTTTESKEDAEKIAREVVEKRLAACAQITGPITSTYWWKDTIEEEDEWLCIMKSTRELYKELEKAIKGIHLYEEPEIVAVPIVMGSRGYLEWIEKEVGSG